MRFAELEDVKPAELKNRENNLLVVDSLNLAFRYKHQRNTGFKQDYISTIYSFAKSYNCDTIVCTGDAGSNYCKAILPEYKANRKAKQEAQTEKEAEDFREFFSEYINTWDSLPFTKLRFAGVEADHIAGYLATKYAPEFDHITLLSSDRDWGLLVSDKVSQFSFVSRKDYTTETFFEYNGVSVEDYITYKCLVGDVGDNVPGVPLIGPKTAVALINKYGSLFDILDSLPINSSLKYIKNLNEFGAERLEINYRVMSLADFSEEALGESNCKTIDRIIKELNNKKRI